MKIWTWREISNTLLPYGLAMLAGALLVWGVGSSCHSKEVRRWQRDYSQLLSSDSVRQGEIARLAKTRDSLSLKADSIGTKDQRISTLRVEMTRSRQEAARALDSLRTTSDSLIVVQGLLMATSGREDTLLVVAEGQQKQITSLKAVFKSYQVTSDSMISQLTLSRDRWKSLAEDVPLEPIVPKLLGLPKPTCVAGVGFVKGFGFGVTCGIPIFH